MGERRKYSFFFLALRARSSRADYQKEFKKITSVYMLEETLKNELGQVRKGEMLAATKVKMCGSEKNK